MSKIDFDGINAAALGRYPQLLESWLPDGKVQGHEYMALNPTRHDTKQGSFKINTQTGVWSDFATGDEGGDPVSLYAYLNGITKQGEAAKALAKDLGIQSLRSIRQCQKKQPLTSRQPVSACEVIAPPSTIRHYKMGVPDHVWAYSDPAGNTIGFVCRFDKSGEKEIRPYTPQRNKDGKLSWKWKSFANPRPLFNLNDLHTHPELPVLLCEGEKATEAAKSLVSDRFVCMTWPGGSNAVNKADWSSLQGRAVSVWPDADEPGFKAALGIIEALRSVESSSVVLIAPPENAGLGWDLADACGDGWSGEKVADWIAHQGHEEQAFRDIAKQRYGIASDNAHRSVPSTFPFTCREDGVYHLNQTDEGTDEEFVCSPLRVLAHARDNDGQSWGRLLEVEDLDGNLHRWAMPMNMTAGSGEMYRATLLDMGLRLAPGTKNKNLLQTYVTQHPVDARARCVPRIGWHPPVFVLPDEVFGNAIDEEVVLQAENVDHAFRVSGTLEEWQESIGRLSEDNSRLVFAIASAFGAPLMELLGVESGGFHFVGGSSIGKTTILEVAGSVCGGGGINGFIQPWRTTDNALEGVAANHCDNLLCLDEIGQVDSKIAGDIAYMLANGQGKSRARKNGTKRKAQEWRVLFLSTGELTLADKIREDGNRRHTAGQSVRIVDIPADAGEGLGAFEYLHGHKDGHTFAQKLKEAARAAYGHPLRAYLKALAEQRDSLSWLAEEVDRFATTLCPPFADGQVQRVARRFALVAIAGEFASRMRILPWCTAKCLEAAEACFAAWLDNRGGIESSETREGLAQVRRFFEAHGSSRFEDLSHGGEDKIVNRAGFKKKTTDGSFEYYVLPQVFREEVCNGFNPVDICRALVERGLLASSSEGKYQVNKSIPHEGGRKQLKVYHFRPGILGGIDG